MNPEDRERDLRKRQWITYTSPLRLLYTSSGEFRFKESDDGS